MTSPTLNHNGMPGGLSSYSDAIASTDLLDDLLGESAELLAQRLEVEAQRRQHDAVDAVVREATDAVEVEHATRGHLDRVGIAPGVLGAGAHRVEQRDEVVVGGATGEEPVAEAAGASGCRRCVPADVNRDGALGRLGVALRPVEARVPALEARLFLAPEGAERVDIFVHSGAAFLERDAERVELLAQPADAHTQLDAPLREHVERREL